MYFLLHTCTKDSDRRSHVEEAVCRLLFSSLSSNLLTQEQQMVYLNSGEVTIVCQYNLVTFKMSMLDISLSTSNSHCLFPYKAAHIVFDESASVIKVHVSHNCLMIQCNKILLKFCLWTASFETGLI